MLDGVVHFRPLVNGDSGFVPRPYSRAMELFAGEPGEDAVRLLRAFGVRHVVTRDERPWPLLERFADDRVYGVPAGEPAHEVVAGEPAAALWAGPAVLVDLGMVRTVSRVVFQLSEGPWRDRPRVTVSRDGVSWGVVEGTASLADATLSLYRDPRLGRGEVRFTPQLTRFVRLDPALPMKPGVVWVGPPGPSR